MTHDHEEQIGKLRLELRDMENDLRKEFLEEIKLIRENHLAHIQASMTIIDGRTVQTATDMEWIKKFFWVVATTSIAGLLTGVMNLILEAQ